MNSPHLHNVLEETSKEVLDILRGQQGMEQQAFKVLSNVIDQLFRAMIHQRMHDFSVSWCEDMIHGKVQETVADICIMYLPLLQQNHAQHNVVEYLIRKKLHGSGDFLSSLIRVQWHQ